MQKKRETYHTKLWIVSGDGTIPPCAHSIQEWQQNLSVNKNRCHKSFVEENRGNKIKKNYPNYNQADLNKVHWKGKHETRFERS